MIDWTNVILAGSTAAAAVFAYLAVRFGRKDQGKAEDKELIKTLVHEETAGLVQRQHEIWGQVQQNTSRGERQENWMRDTTSRLGEIMERMVSVETKISLYWQQVAMNAAKTLHQPHPGRRVIDSLLEAFMEGTLTEDERIELKKALVLIRNWEPGADIGFPVLPGEQVAAAILLSTMDLVNPQLIATSGHAAHRAIRHAGE